MTNVVAAPDTPPSITGLADLTAVPGAIVGPLSIAINDAETLPQDLHVTVTSSKAAIVPPANITLSGTGSIRNLTIQLPGGNIAGSSTITLKVTDDGGLTAITSFTVSIPAVYLPKLVAAGSAIGQSPLVSIYKPDGSLKFNYQAYDGGFTGGVRTAMADFNGDGVDDLVVASGPGRSGNVQILDGVTFGYLFTINPFGDEFTRGVVVTAGDITGDRKAELVITAESGGGARIRVFSPAATGFQQIADFIGIIDGNGQADTAFRGGGRAAIGDLNNDGYGDLVFAAGA